MPILPTVTSACPDDPRTGHDDGTTRRRLLRRRAAAELLRRPMAPGKIGRDRRPAPPLLRNPMQVIPAIDVLDGKVVRLFQGDFARVTAVWGRPAANRRKLPPGRGGEAAPGKPPGSAGRPRRRRFPGPGFPPFSNHRGAGRRRHPRPAGRGAHVGRRRRRGGARNDAFCRARGGPRRPRSVWTLIRHRRPRHRRRRGEGPRLAGHERPIVGGRGAMDRGTGNLAGAGDRYFARRHAERSQRGAVRRVGAALPRAADHGQRRRPRRVGYPRVGGGRLQCRGRGPRAAGPFRRVGIAAGCLSARPSRLQFAGGTPAPRCWRFASSPAWT